MTTLTGPFGGTLEAAAQLLADTPAFRTWVTPAYDPDDDRTEEQETAAHALAYSHIYFYTEPNDNGASRPFVVISLSDDSSLNTPSASGFNVWITGGVNVMFENDSSYSNNTQLQSGTNEFLSDIFGIIDSLITVVEADTGGTYLIPSGVKPVSKVVASDRAAGDPGDYFQWVWMLEVGP